MQVQMTDTVENIYIYVSDALRYDKAPERLKKYGEIVKTASSATNTCSEFPTIVTGLYPPQHGVWTFSGLIDPSVQTLFDLVEGPSPVYWMPSPIRDSIDSVDSHGNLHEFFSTLADIDSPFIALDRDNLTHLPYGYDNTPGIEATENRYGYDMSSTLKYSSEDLSTDEYLSLRTGQQNRMRAEYEQGAEASARRFENRLNILRDLGLLENTLVIFTADHGEELGEYGRFTHGMTPVPETVYVPTLFYRDDASIAVDGEFMSHTDIFPTVAAALDRSAPRGLPGYNLLQGAPDQRMVFSGIITQSYFGDRLEYGSWDCDGGHSFSERTKDLVPEILSFARDGNYSMPQLLNVVKGEFKRRNQTFGTPNHSREEGRIFCEDVLSRSVSEQKQELDEDVKDHLRDLGYAEDTIE